MKERATVICRRDDTVLFVRHRIRWTLPGGIVRANECPRQCAHRELEEETSLVAVSSAYLWQFVGFNKRHHVFIVEIADGADPQPRNQIRTCRWFVPRDIETLLVSVPTRPILEPVSGRRGHAGLWTNQRPRKAELHDQHLPWE
jgi:8-oxo-dGTP diphosphatase